MYPACQNLLLAARGLGYGGVLTMWHHTVENELKELLAIPEGVALSAWRHKENAKALDALQAIILDAETPQGLRQRAELLLAVVRAGPIR